MASPSPSFTSSSSSSSRGKSNQQSTESYYDVLEEELRTAYMRRALEEHPDRNPTRIAEATARFQLVADAYYTLSDPTRRAAYDDLLRSRRPAPQEHTEPNTLFSNVFEELLRPEVERVMPLWQPLGAISGAVLGFIMGNVPGMLASGVAGGYLGKIRDAKGKSVGEVFLSLPGAQRTLVLTHIAQKILGTAVSAATGGSSSSGSR